MLRKTKKWLSAWILTGVMACSLHGWNPVMAQAQEVEPTVSEVQQSTVQSASTLKASISKVTLDKGDTKKVTLTYGGSSLSASKATWTTSKSSVATVSSSGTITAKGKGTATITAKYSGKSVTIKVTVNEEDGLVANKSKLTLKKGDTSTIALTYNGKALTGSSANWTTSKSSVATVKNGVITAKAKGTATITAKYKGETVKINVTVEDAAKLTVTQSQLSLKKGEKKTIQLKYNGASVSGSSADWVSSDEAVATVNNGVVTAKGKGKATIAVAYKGEFADVEVTVTDSKNLLEAVQTKVTLEAGETHTLRLKYDGANVSASKAIWTSSKSSVASVKDGVVTAKAKGTATISAFYKDEIVDIQITVNESKSKLEVKKTKITLKKGETEKVKLTYNGDSLSNTKATWGTSKSSVATVEDNGTIKAKAKGTATITATYKGAKATVEVTVEEADSLEVDDDSISVKVGKKKTIKVTYKGKKVDGSDVKWSTSKSSVATVKEGVVTGKKKGTAYITAKYKGEEVEIKVKVN